MQGETHNNNNNKIIRARDCTHRSVEDGTSQPCGFRPDPTGARRRFPGQCTRTRRRRHPQLLNGEYLAVVDIRFGVGALHSRFVLPALQRLSLKREPCRRPAVSAL